MMKKALYLCALWPLLLACSHHPHEDAVRIAVSKWGWKRSAIEVQQSTPFAAEHTDIPCTFYALRALDRLDGGVFVFAEDSQGRLVGTSADADYMGLSRVLQQCLSASNNSHVWAGVVADYISAGWLSVVEEHNKLTQLQIAEAQLTWHPPILRQTSAGHEVEFWATHGFSMDVVHIRATLYHDGRVSVEESTQLR